MGEGGRERERRREVFSGLDTPDHGNWGDEGQQGRSAGGTPKTLPTVVNRVLEHTHMHLFHVTIVKLSS